MWYCKGYRKKETIVSCYRCDEQFCEVCASVLTDANIKSDIKFQGLDLPDSEIHLCRVVTKLIVDEDIFWSDHMRILGLKELHYRLDFKKKVETGSKGSCVTWDDNLWEKFYSKLLTKDGWDENLVDTLFIRLIKEEELVKQLLDEEQ